MENKKHLTGKSHLPLYGVGPVTTGVYALAHNPIYSAFMIFCTGALLISGNLFFIRGSFSTGFL